MIGDKCDDLEQQVNPRVKIRFQIKQSAPVCLQIATGIEFE